MTGIIEKIGQYFAQLEHEQQRAVALATTQSPAPLTAAAATNRGVDRVSRRTASFAGADAATVRRSPSVTRRRLSLQATEHPPQRGLCHEATTSPALGPAKQVVPPLAQPLHPVWGDDDSANDGNGESLASWRSLTSPPTSEKSGSATSRGATDSITEEDGRNERRASRESKSSSGVHVIPRKKETKKRKPPSPASLELQAAAKEREKSERVANGLALAQERAQRIKEEAQQQARARRQARQEAIDKIKAQLERIEEVRARRSVSQSLSMASTSSISALSSYRSSMSRESSCSSYLESVNGLECLSSRSTGGQISHQESWDVVDSSYPHEISGGDQEKQHQPHQPVDTSTVRETAFLSELEFRMRDQMLLQLQFRKRCLDAKKRRERLQYQLARTLQANKSKQARVTSLEQTKDAVEKQLSCVLDELNALRKQRHELEEAGRNERLRRQKEVERVLQRRLREEEWAKLMDEEKARTVVAAEAREKASERVQKAHWSGMQRTSNTLHQALRLQKPNQRGSNFIASLGPELAEFEEEGLCPTAETGRDDANAMRPTSSNQEKEKEETPPFKWLVPPYDRHADEFGALLLTEMLSDDEDE